VRHGLSIRLHRAMPAIESGAVFFRADSTFYEKAVSARGNKSKSRKVRPDHERVERQQESEAVGV